MTGHPSQDELADHVADPSSSPAGDDQIAAHLRTCAQCRERLDQLTRDSAGVRSLLAAEPAPSMPDEVFARISGALRDEQADRGSAGSAANAGSAGVPVDLTVARNERARRSGRVVGRARLGRSARLLAAAAAVVVAAGVGVSIFTHGGLGPAGTSNNAASTGASSTRTGGAASGSSSASLTALGTAHFARDVRALLAASPMPHRAGSGNAGTAGGQNGPARTRLKGSGNGSLATGPATCTTKVLAGTRFSHQTLSAPRPVTVDGARAQLVVATDGQGRRTAIALGGCGGKHPHVLVKAGL